MGGVERDSWNINLYTVGRRRKEGKRHSKIFDVREQIGGPRRSRQDKLSNAAGWDHD